MIWVVFLIAAVAVNFAPNSTIDTNCPRLYRALIIVVLGALLGLTGNTLAAFLFMMIAFFIYAIKLRVWQWLDKS